MRGVNNYVEFRKKKKSEFYAVKTPRIIVSLLECDFYNWYSLEIFFVLNPMSIVRGRPNPY